MCFCLIHVQQRSVIDLSHPRLLPQFTNLLLSKNFYNSDRAIITFQFSHVNITLHVTNTSPEES